MYAHGVVEKSDSPWGAPVVMVKKKDGRWRFCIDFRMTINKVCVNSATPLPKIADVLEKLSSAKIMSCYDIQWGYWNVLVRAQDRKYLAFLADDQLWQFRSF